MMRRAFTLIELLVVIAISVVLVGLLIPILHHVREQAWSIACRSNIRQLQLGFQAYESENRTLPYGYRFSTRGPIPGRPNYYPGTLTLDAPGWWWFNYLGLQVESSNHKRQDGMPQCPAKHLQDRMLDWDNLWGNYGANRALCTSVLDMPPYSHVYDQPPVSTSSLRRPGSTLLVMDSGYALICWWHATANPPVTLKSSAADTSYVPGLDINKTRVLQPGQILDAINGRHPGKTINAGFADGHVERKKAQDLLVEETDEDTYTNRTPLWEPR
jgi:prepilin-type N-terminal cleavage/methylation domain-containing protein/prepilin-type processing-associated H-X9-DG protein